MALRILVVEDDKHIRRILESLLANEPSLKARNSEVISAADGELGLKALEKGPFDLVITDLLMPRVDGFQFCRELRKHKFGATVPVIVTSAIYKDNAAQLRLKKEVGEHHFFAKPYEIKDLVKTVHKILDGAKPQPQKDPTPAVGVPVADRAESGSLEERAVARVLLDLHDRKATGLISIVRGKVKKEVGLHSGILTSCESNLRSETLGHFLVSRGILDEKRHQAALTRAQARNELLGQALIELGWINEKDLLHQLAAQMRSKIAGMLRWRDGSFTYTPGAPPSDRVQTPVEAPLLIFLGLSKTAHVDEIAQLLAGSRGRVALTVRAERHRETFIRVFGPLGFDALARKPLIEDLMSVSDPAQMLTHLDALLLCGLAEIDSSAAAKRDFHEATDPVALERILSPSAPARAPQQENLYDSLFGEEPSEVKPIPLQPPPAADEPLRKEILAEYLALPTRNLYETLGVSPSADADGLEEALRQKLHQFRLERFADVDLGSDYAKVEELHQAFQSAYETLTTNRAEYDHSLAPKTSSRIIDAELLGREAEALLLAGEAVRARAKLEAAVAAAPEQSHYHALLGWAWHLTKDLRRAAASLQQALTLDPDDADAHDFVGRIAAASGDDERAIKHLEHVLDAEPDRAEALAALETVYHRQSAWKSLERRYRKLIHRAGEGPLRVGLWTRLAELYLNKINDRDSAKVAYEVLAKLVPDDPAPRAALARLGAPTVGNRFMEQVNAENWDAAFVAAACAGEDPAAAEYYRRYRPRFLQRAVFEPDTWASLRHPDDDAELTRLFAHLVPTADPPGDPVELLPVSFGRVLAYVAGALGVPVPPVRRLAELGSEVQMQQPALLAGPQALALADRPQLAFRIGRALSLPAAGWLTSRQLKDLLLASFLLVSPTLRVEDPDGAIARQRDRLAGTPLKKELTPLIEKLMKTAGLNVSKYARGLARTAERVGLLLCNDPAVALRLVSPNDELLAFVLSDEYLALRERLGLAIAV